MTSEVIAVSILISLLFQHDTWLVAWIKGDLVEAKATSSDRFPEPDAGIRAERVARAGLIRPSGETPATDIQPSDHETALSWANPQSGPKVAGLVLHPHPIELDEVKFEHYLRSEELLDEFGPRIQSSNRERYTKCAKAVPEGVTLEEVRGLRAGHPLEIVEADQGFVVLLHGEPLETCSVRPVIDSGQGLCGLRAHTMWPVEAGDHEWESLWATFTFFRQP